MKYFFTAEEKTIIQNAIQQSTGLILGPDGRITASNSVGSNAAPLYETLSGILADKLKSGESFAPEVLADIKSAKLWLDVAIGANMGVGMHSAFIRTYTNIQGELRLGQAFSDSEMQLASNAVARNVANGLMFGSDDGTLPAWALPGISEIAGLDASAIGEALFSGKLLDTDTSISTNSAWSGALGFSLLGGTSPFETWRLIYGGDRGKMDTVEDLKNVIFATHAYGKAVIAGYAQGAQDFLSAWAIPENWREFIAQWNVGTSSNAFLGLVSDTVKNTPLAEPYAQLTNVGLDDTLAALARVARITPVSTNTMDKAKAVFAAIPSNATIEYLGDLTAEQLATRALQNPETLSALIALSPYSVSGFTHKDETISKAWLLDRAKMLLATINEAWQGTIHYVDESTGIHAYADSVDNQALQVVFDADVNSGTAGRDRLYSLRTQDVILDGKAGTDWLIGAAGNDWLGYTAAATTAGSLTERDSDGNYYEGGTGTDHIFGSINADRIRFSQGDGTDIVTGNGGADILEYVADGAFLTTSREGKSLVLSRTLANGTVDRIVMQNWYADIPAESMRLDRVDFGAIDPTTGLFVASGSLSGDILNEQGLHKQIGTTTQELRGDLLAYQETLQGSDRSDWLYSSQAADENSVGDVLVGGKGDDYLYGSIGADKVRIGAGDGKDFFRGNGGADIVETYDGISITHMHTKLDKVGADLRATFTDGTQLTIRDWDVEGKLMAFREGRIGSLVGYDWVNQNLDNFYGDAGVNVITGNALANELYGYGGADRLVGGGGNDQFWGGTGNDELIGGTGNDAFYFGFDDGVDHIWGGGGGDVLNFQASGQGHPLTASRVGNDIKFSYSASDSVTVHDWFSNAGAAMTVNLPNGQVMSPTQINAGFTMKLPRWIGDSKPSSEFQFEIYKTLPGAWRMDEYSLASKGYSFFLNSLATGYGLRQNFTGHYHGEEKIYKGALAMAQPGYGYVHLTWEYWKAGPGAYKFVITGGESGRTGKGASYALTGENNLNAIRSNPSIDFRPETYYSKTWTDIIVSTGSFQLYNGSYSQAATSLSLYDIDSFSIENNDNIYSAAVGSNMAEIVGVSNPELMYLA